MDESNDDTTWKERTKKCREVMNELLETEFKEKIKKTACLGIREIPVGKSGTAVEAHIYMRLLRYWAVIYINKACWNKSGFGEQEIRDILRHELLHLELMKGDDDPEFRKEAKRRGISVNAPSREMMCWLCLHCVQNCKKCEWEMTESCIGFFPAKS